MRILVIGFFLAISVISAAQVLNLSQSTAIIGQQSLPPCLGLASECAAHANASIHNSTPPAIWNESDINPGMGVQYLRVTDCNTMGTGTCHQYVATPSGGSYDNMFNNLNDRFMVADASEGQCIPYIFDTAHFTTTPFTKMYNTGYSIGCNNSWFWSYTQSYIGYTMVQPGHPPQILQYNYASTVTPPTKQVLVDFSTLPNCLPPGFTMQSSGVITVSKDDQTFSVVVGNTSNRRYEVVWNRTSGCRVWDLQAQTISGNWGASGNTTQNGNTTFYAHESYLMQNGAPNTTYVLIGAEPGTCSGTCIAGGNGRWVWQVNTTTISPMVNPNDGAGHIVMGYQSWATQIATGIQTGLEYFLRAANEPNPSPHAVELIAPTPFFALMDSHQSWHNDNAGDNVPFFSSTLNGQAGATNVISHPYQAEILAVPTACYVKDKLSSCASNRPYRIGHTYADITTQTTNFEDAYGIGTISSTPSNGYYYFALSTNWVSRFGCTNGTYAPCSGSGVFPRPDFVIVRIPTTGTSITKN